MKLFITPNALSPLVFLKALFAMKFLQGLLFVIVSGLFAGNVSAALPGDLDTGFNTTDIGLGYGDGADGIVNASAIQADGKIIIVGEFQTYNGIARNHIARLNVDGTLDTTFNPGTGATGGDINAVAIQAHDGKIIIVGSFTAVGGTAKNRIARLWPDGSLDTNFSGGANAAVNAVVVQPDKKILVGGTFTTLGSTTKNRIARLNQDGSLDTNFTASVSAAVNTIAIDANGNIVLGGAFTTSNGSTPSAGILRLMPTNGATDTTFVSGAGVTGGAVKALAIDSAGKIVIAGDFTKYNNVTRTRIARINSDGSLDTAFVPATTGANAVINTLQLAGGAILIGGNFTSYNGMASPYLARVLPNGMGDGTFSSGNSIDAAINGLTVQSDGKIIIGGAFVSYKGVKRNRIARINNDASLDSFNGGSGIDGQVSAVAVQTDGKIIIGGTFTTVNGITRNNIARLNTNGTLDTDFNANVNAAVSAIFISKLQAGKIFIGGNFTQVGGVARNRIARLDMNGALDTTFNPGTGANGTVQVITEHAAGLLIGGAFTTVNGVTKKYIARLSINGTPDSLFVPNVVGTSVNAIVTKDNDVAAPIYIGGVFTTVSGSARANIASLNANGVINATFAPGTGAITGGGVNALAMDSAGKILLAGAFTKYNGVTQNHIARVSSNGVLDATFSPLGGATAGVAGGDVNALVVQSDGRIVIAGNFTSYDGVVSNTIATVRMNGLLDLTFNPVAGANAVINALALQNDGKVIIGGAFVSYNGIGKNRVARLYDNTDTDSDTLTDAQEIALNNNPLNPLDPPVMGVSASPLLGMEDPALGAGSTVNVQVWSGQTGGLYGAVPVPRSMDIDGNDDGCAVGSQGVWCSNWQFGGVDVVGVTHDANNFLTPAITDAFRIASSATHACIISKSLGIKCWGTNSTDHLVNPSYIPSTTPNTVTDIAVGPQHACVVYGITILCWGDNTSGQAPYVVVPGVPFGTGSAPSLQIGDVPLQVAVGVKHSCAIVRNGTSTAVRCWGDNAKGQKNIPAMTSPLRIAAGDDYTCAITGNFAPGSNSVVCWGDNSQYQTYVPSGLINPVAIKAGGRNTCVAQAGRNTAVASMKCWPIGLNTGTDTNTNWYATDSDHDGISDTDELSNPTMTNPQSSDTDNDGVWDGVDPYPTDPAKTAEEADATYAYNHLGQRISKTVGSATTYFIYSDVDGQMLGEYKADGSPIRQYMYVEGERVAMMSYNTYGMEIIYLGNNHIGVPQYAWDTNGTPVYERVQAPFGESQRITGSVKIPLRFPGQYADAETGFNQNWNRDYDPSIGRYMQSDPIGILKDFNHGPEFNNALVEVPDFLKDKGDDLNHLYGYVNQNPLMNIDDTGLLSVGDAIKKLLGGAGEAAISCPANYPFKGGIEKEWLVCSSFCCTQTDGACREQCYQEWELRCPKAAE